MTAAAHAVPTMECPRCKVDVPAANFCGLCGCQGGHLKVLRPKTFGAEPRERVLLPFLASSLFPHLPAESRTPFRVAMAVAAAGLIASAVLRLPALGITISALGLPLLFVLYLRASSADRDVPRIALTLAAVLGALLGAVWVAASGAFVARTYGVPMSVGLALHHLFREGLVIPVAGMILMVVPVVTVRLVRPGYRESLDGFVIGALSGLAFSATATMARLAPQVGAGLIAHARPLQGLVVEVVLCGVTVPITAAAAGGMVGIALWFKQRDGDAEHHGRVRRMLVLLAAVALLLHAAVAVIDNVGLRELVMLALHLSVTVITLILLRTAMQLALLHEVQDPVAEDQPRLCTRCEMVVPDMAFCPHCGAATRAASRRSRQECRGGSCRVLADDAVEVATAPGAVTAEQPYPAYAMPEDGYAAPAPRRPRFGWLLSRWGTTIATAAAVMAAAAFALTPRIAHYMCPPDCGKPPSGSPVKALPRFESPDGSFSVSYPAPGSFYDVKTEKSGVTATLTAGDGGVMQLFSEPANGRSARQVATAVLKRTYPDSTVAYEIPNAMVGYQIGYGEVADDWPQGSTSSFSRIRIVVLAAVKNNLALVAFATGPYHAFGPDFGPGPPSGANLELAQDLGKYVNSFRWTGDPTR
ncbi:MAG: zinc ribbon domain-containing protein [Mycobacterium sp.]